MRNWLIDLAASVDRIIVSQTEGKATTVELIDRLGGYTTVGVAAPVDKDQASIKLGYPHAFRKAMEQMVDRYSYASLMPGYGDWHLETHIRENHLSFLDRITEEGCRVYLVRNNVLYPITYTFSNGEYKGVRTIFGKHKQRDGDYFIFAFDC